jgi:hypothetical protein
MTRTFWKLALALGAALAATSATSAGDTVPLTGAGGATLTLGGQGTAAQAAGEDNELTHGRRWGGGWGYRGGYRTGWYGGGWGGYYRPAYYYYAPRVYYPTYYRVAPVYPTYYYNDCAPGVSFTFGISGGAASGAPALTLGARPVVPQPMPSVGPDGTFRYDGGPAIPVPLPKADPQLIPPANPLPSATDLPISGKPKPAPYKYKAYGEK